MAGRVQHLVQHSHGYLWRRRLPEPLARLLGRTHIKRALATRDRRVAVRRAREASARVERLRAEVEQAMSEGRLPTRDDLLAVLAAFFRDLLDVGERRRDRTRGTPYWEAFQQATQDHDETTPTEVIDAELATLPPLEPEDDPDGRVSMAEHDERQNRREAVQQRLDVILAQQGVALPHDHPAYARLCRLALRVRVEAAKIDAARDYGNHTDGYPQAPASVPPEAVPDPGGGARTLPRPASVGTAPVPAPEVAPAASNAPLLSQAWAEFVAEKVGGGDWSDTKTRRDAERALLMWCELMDDCPTDRITRRTALDFRERIRGVPARNGKGIYQNKSLKEALALASDIRQQLKDNNTAVRVPGGVRPAAEAEALIEPVKLKTVNKVLTFFTTFGRWAKDHERDEWFADRRNPFEDLLHSKRAVRRQIDRYEAPKAMPDEVLRLLFASPIWTGRQPGADTVEGDVVLRDHKYWIPLIGLFSGMRLGEIAQLRLRDISDCQGVKVFNVGNSSETSTKTESGNRVVPIHDELLRLGILDRAADLRRRGEHQLFPEISPRASADDDFGATFSRWFSRYRYGLAQRPGEAGRRYAALGEKAYVFHALRHTFITRARETQEMTDAQLDRLIGHKGQATRDIYTGPLSLDRLANAVNAVRFDLDLSRLYPKARRLAAE